MPGDMIGVVGYSGKNRPGKEFLTKGIDKLPVSNILWYICNTNYSIMHLKEL
jgi:hypothetical protein